MKFLLSAISLALLPQVLAIPFADASADAPPLNTSINPRDTSLIELSKRNKTPPPPVQKQDCQKPVAQNLCTSGTPYCCSGDGSSQVCGPAASVSCQSTAICCINTNGVRIYPTLI